MFSSHMIFISLYIYLYFIHFTTVISFTTTRIVIIISYSLTQMTDYYCEYMCM